MKKIASKKVDGILIVEVLQGNLNGGPDTNGNPRESNGYGIVSSFSTKRKVRDMLDDHDGIVFQELAEKTGIRKEEFGCYDILESISRGFDADDPLAAKKEFLKLTTEEKCKKYVDVRLFGGMFLDEQGEKGSKDKKFVKSGVVQIGHGRSVAPVSIVNQTITRKSSTANDKIGKNDMAPDGMKFVEHALYVIPFCISPASAHKTETTETDIELFKNCLPYIYSANMSSARPGGSINIIHAWWAEHTNALGSFNATELLSHLMPVKKGDKNTPSTSIDDYEIPNIKDSRLVDLV